MASERSRTKNSPTEYGETGHSETSYRWYILILAALTNTLTVAIPSMCLPVLFEEIRGELDLSLSEVGFVWGIGSLPGVFMVLVGGIIGDRFGPKRILVVTCFLAGLFGALRGLSNDLITLTAAVVLFGFVSSTISMNGLKACGLWFSRKQLGLASGVLSMGMALGFLTGSMVSATVLSPWLGGWRNVLMLYGVVAMTLSIPWYFTRPAPVPVDPSTGGADPKSLRQTLSYVGQIKKMWLMGWAILGIGGCIQGALGYLPLYLRDMGWAETNADTAAASFHLASLVLVVPIALWSDRLGSRKKVLLAAAFMVAVGVGLLSVVDGVMVWMAVIMAGMVRDGFMAVFLTMIIETEGVGAAYAGTATGFVMVFSGLGGLLAPPLGNSLADLSPGAPFVFWAALTVIGALGIYAAREERPESVLVVRPAGQVG